MTTGLALEYFNVGFSTPTKTSGDDAAMPSKKVFISYAGHEGKFAAENLVAAFNDCLRDKGSGIVWASQISFGDNWVNKIEEMVGGASVCLLVLSASSHESKWQMYEYITFTKNMGSLKGNLIPICLGPDLPEWFDKTIQTNKTPLSALDNNGVMSYLNDLLKQLCIRLELPENHVEAKVNNYSFIDGVNFSPAGSASFGVFVNEIRVAARAYQNPGSVKIFNIEFQTFEVPVFWQLIIEKSSSLQIALPDRKFTQLEKRFKNHEDTLINFLGLGRMRGQIKSNRQLLSRLVALIRGNRALVDENGYLYKGDDRQDFTHVLPNIQFRPYVEETQDVSTAYSLFSPSAGDSGACITYVFPKALPFAEYDEKENRWGLKMFGRGTSADNHRTLDGHFDKKVSGLPTFSPIDIAVLILENHPAKLEVARIHPYLNVNDNVARVEVLHVPPIPEGGAERTALPIFKINVLDHAASVILSWAHSGTSFKNITRLHNGEFPDKWQNALLWVGPWSLALKWLKATAKDFDHKLSRHYSIYHLKFETPNAQFTTLAEVVIRTAIKKLLRRYQKVTIVATSVNAFAALSAIASQAAAFNGVVPKIVLLSPAIDLFDALESFSRKASGLPFFGVSKVRHHYSTCPVEGNPPVVKADAATYFGFTANELHLLDFINRGKAWCDFSRFSSCLSALSTDFEIMICYNLADEMVDYTTLVKTPLRSGLITLHEYSWYHSVSIDTFVSPIQGKPDIFKIGIDQVHAFLLEGVSPCPYLVEEGKITVRRRNSSSRRTAKNVSTKIDSDV